MAARLGGNSNYSMYMVAGAGLYICVCSPKNRAKMIAYDFSKKEWEEWPSCPFPPGIREKWETWPWTSLSHNGVSGHKKASSLLDYQVSYLPV